MTTTCPQCNGTGQVRAAFLRTWIKRMFRAEERKDIVHDDVRTIPCPVCHGTGRVNAKR